MSAIFLAFANSPEDRLPTLSQEDDQVYAILSQRAVQGHFVIHRDSYATTPKIIDFLILYREYLTVFHFSGHAGKDTLFMEDEAANAMGIAHLLGQCPNLKLVILNGCSTAGQVQRLVKLPNHPLVVATDAPVNDFAATRFAVAFYQTLSSQFDVVENAFQAGLGAAQLGQAQEIRAGRKDMLVNNNRESLWGLYYAPEGEIILSWKLPTSFQVSFNSYQPNVILIDTLIKTLAPHRQEIEQIVQDETQGVKRSIVDKREFILQCFPHPVSEQLRKLIVPELTGYGAIFYDKTGPDRLRQITLTYSTIIELINAVMLSQLWNVLMLQPKLEIHDSQRDLIRHFFLLSFQERAIYNFFPLIRTIREIFDQNEVSYFVEELTQVSQVFNEQSDFYNACIFMETLKQRFAKRLLFEKVEADQLCPIAEEKLAEIFAKLSFLARYTMISVKDIDVLKYRHIMIPTFRHKMVKLIARQGGIAEEPEDLVEYLDSASVLMQRSDEKLKFLNLSPFVIDENAFDEKATDSRLYFFDRYDQASDIYIFRHIYKPEDQPLIIHKQASFAVIKDQFDAFAQLLFQNPMHTL